MPCAACASPAARMDDPKRDAAVKANAARVGIATPKVAKCDLPLVRPPTIITAMHRTDAKAAAVEW